MQPGFHWRRNVTISCLTVKYIRSKRQHSHCSVLQAVLCFDLIPTGGFLNSDTLFFGSMLVADVVHCSTLSVTHCSSPNGYHYSHSQRIVSMNSKYWVCSRNGFSISYSFATRALTSYTNAACTPDCCYL